MPRSAVFLINLLQDVNIARPLIFLAARDVKLDTHILTTFEFRKYDKSGQWAREIAEIAAGAGATVRQIATASEAMHFLEGRGGALIAASESELQPHAPTHTILSLAPKSFLRITLQHGFECVGFLQSRDHDIAHGPQVTFAADIVCGWCHGKRLTSLAPSQRSKLVVTGPPAVLQIAPSTGRVGRSGTGLVCENLHSARLNAAGDFKASFIETFTAFADMLARHRQRVSLRPHPGGQYVIRNKVKLPPNAILRNEPIYKVDLRDYYYGISAPSSIVIDMILAGIPVGVWRERSGVMDLGNYRGLTEIGTAQEWFEFSREAAHRPEPFLERQAAFLARQSMLTDAREVHRRFSELFISTRDFVSADWPAAHHSGREI
jgi:hypothetical protein